MIERIKRRVVTGLLAAAAIGAITQSIYMLWEYGFIAMLFSLVLIILLAKWVVSE